MASKHPALSALGAYSQFSSALLALEKIYYQYTSRVGLNIREALIVSALGKSPNDGLVESEISAQIRVSENVLRATCSRLLANGYLRRFPTKKGFKIKLTSDGVLLAEKLSEAEQEIDNILSGLDDVSMGVVRDIVSQIILISNSI